MIKCDDHTHDCPYLNRRFEELKGLLEEAVEFLDDYADAEYIDGAPTGNYAMNLMCRMEEILDD